MNIRFKVFAPYNILQYLCDYIHVLIVVTVSKCRKSPKLTNILINACEITSVCLCGLSTVQDEVFLDGLGTRKAWNG